MPRHTQQYVIRAAVNRHRLQTLFLNEPHGGVSQIMHKESSQDDMQGNVIMERGTGCVLGAREKSASKMHIAQ